MNQSKASDQTLYCDNCGISFLWSAEEQKALAAQKTNSIPPSRCPGCRIILPAPGRERGLVKWYNHRKRYGFLVRRDHPELFAHGSDLVEAKSLRPGDLVEFSIESGERGPVAKEIVVLGHGDAPVLD